MAGTLVREVISVDLSGHRARRIDDRDGEKRRGSTERKDRAGGGIVATVQCEPHTETEPGIGVCVTSVVARPSPKSLIAGIAGLN